MAKKKKIEIIDRELTPTVLAVKADKKKTSIFSIIWVVFIFAIFIGGVIYLPDIALYINNYLDPETSTPSGGKKPVENPNEPSEPTEEITEYNLIDNPVIETEKFTVRNFKINENTLSFEIFNTSSEVLDMDNYNYFLTLYNDGKKLIQRSMIKEAVVNPSGNYEYSIKLNENVVSKFTFAEITTEEYPSVTLKLDDNGTGNMVCKKDNETTTYYYTTHKLSAISDDFEVSTSDQNYATLYSNYQALASTYNSIGGVSSSVTVENNLMKFRTIINLNTITEGTYNSKIYYPKDTEAKIISFELESSGFECE